MEQEFEQQLLQSQIEVQEQTFTTMSQEIHDNVGQLLGSAKMLIGITGRSMPEAPETLKTADETIGKAITDLRALSKSYNKEWLHSFSLLENLENEAKRINLSQATHLRVEHEPDSLSLQPERQLILFRIIQEAIRNGITHGEASEILIKFKNDKEILYVSIIDNGKGFDINNQHKSGIGLINLQHRTRLLNGQIEWKSKPAEGTTVTIRIPLN